jgi:hypothetical protein
LKITPLTHFLHNLYYTKEENRHTSPLTQSPRRYSDLSPVYLHQTLHYSQPQPQTLLLVAIPVELYKRTHIITLFLGHAPTVIPHRQTIPVPLRHSFHLNGSARFRKLESVTDNLKKQLV